MTWKEKEVRKKLGKIAIEERRKGKSVWVEGDKIRVEGNGGGGRRKRIYWRKGGI